MAIYTKFGKQSSIRKFIELLFNYHRHMCRTNVETYKDSNCKIIQCNENKYRSFEDVFECVQTYYKNITVKGLLHILLTTNLKDESEAQLNLCMGTCSTIGRIRMFYHASFETYMFQHTTKYNSKYSWKELLVMLNIYSEEDLRKYIKKYRK